jgi:hypothetical protein
MIYNRSSPYACAYTRRDEMLANSECPKTRLPYPRLLKTRFRGCASLFVQACVLPKAKILHSFIPEKQSARRIRNRVGA